MGQMKLLGRLSVAERADSFGGHRTGVDSGREFGGQDLSGCHVREPDSVSQCRTGGIAPKLILGFTAPWGTALLILRGDTAPKLILRANQRAFRLSGGDVREPDSVSRHRTNRDSLRVMSPGCAWPLACFA